MKDPKTIGYIDGNWDNLKKSLFQLIDTVNHEKIVHPGHGDDTTLKHELVSNPFLTSA